MTPLAPVGKMAFSNYVTHSFIGNFVFLNAGLGYMGQVGPVYCTLFAIFVFVLQILLSTSGYIILTLGLSSGYGEVPHIKNGKLSLGLVDVFKK